MNEGPIRVAVAGALGRMGRTTCEAVSADPELVLAAAIDPGFGAGGTEVATGGGFEVGGSFGAAAGRGSEAGRGAGVSAERCFTSLEEALAAGQVDVVVDFTTPAVVRENVLTCLRHGVPAVVGTTGLTTEDLATIEQECEERGVPVLVAPNFALGAVLMMQFARQAAQHLGACEIVELHHDRKLDAPSGTAKLTRSLIEENWRNRGLDKAVPIHSVRLPGLVAHQEVIFGGLGETLTIRHDSLSRESFMPGVLAAVKRVRHLQGLVIGLENIL
ncbi:MAG: 4-hydroxy-tetrahydrodipicolinate reductase [Thermoleophilia bacterium]|nr:4-hydroxy-tetrahydrodipicolinate reductase [Thermoleophilia bacterium]